MKTPVIILGGGGHAKVLIDILKINGISILGYTDKEYKQEISTVFDIPYLGSDEIIYQYKKDQIKLVNGIGSTKQPLFRKSIYNNFKSRGYTFSQTIHPSAVISSNVKLAEGVQIMAGVIIQVGSSIEENSILNTKVSIDHDCTIKKHVHIAPGVTISGNVKVQEGVHIGTGAVVIQNINIGYNSLIGAGALVIDNVENGVTVFGVPAKVV